MALTFGTAPAILTGAGALAVHLAQSSPSRSGATACSKSRATAQLFVALLVEHVNESGEPRSCLPVGPHIATRDGEDCHAGKHSDKIWMGSPSGSLDELRY